MDKQQTQHPVAWVNCDELDNMLDDRTATVAGVCDGWRSTPLYTATPVPRDVMMAFGEAVRDAVWEESGEGWNGEYPGNAMPKVDISALADHYASQVQPVGRDAVALLREIEWENNKWAECCPVCGGHKKDGHAVDCKLAATLSCQQPASAQPVAVPDGWQLVPKEPTRAMLDAAHTNFRKDIGIDPLLKTSYRAMLSAAQKPEGGE